MSYPGVSWNKRRRLRTRVYCILVLVDVCTIHRRHLGLDGGRVKTEVESENEEEGGGEMVEDEDTVEEEGGGGEETREGLEGEDNIEELYDMEHYDSEEEGEGERIDVGMQRCTGLTY